MTDVIPSSRPAHAAEGDVLVVTLGEGKERRGTVWQLGDAAADWAQGLVDSGDLSGKELSARLFVPAPGVAARRLLVVGIGEREPLDAITAFRAAGTAAKVLAERPRDVVTYWFGSLESEVAQAAVVGSITGAVGQDLLRSEKSLHPPATVAWCEVESRDLDRGRILGESVLLARELVNLPPNLMYPETFVLRAADVAVQCGLEIEVWDELRLRRENCNALLAVSAGSSRPPRLLVLKHAGSSQQDPVALVGKGVTFDSGGLSLKPSASMLTMKCDMAGAATVLATMQAVARLEVRRPVVGLVGLVENMVSGSSYKLGDVLTTRSGTTVEIHNTDAEGRLVLADVLDVAVEHAPRHIVDVATLTGACVVALGTDVAGVMSNDPDWEQRIRSAAERSGEQIWPLPMFREFGEQIKSQVADIKNVGEGRWGGAITAAKFLEAFVKGTSWAHIDIAGPAFLEKPKPYLDAGGSGVVVRTLVQLIDGLSE